MECQRCGGTNDVIDFLVGYDKHVLCAECRVKAFAPPKSIGRPPLGVTKKVSITVPQDDWDWVDGCVKTGLASNQSELFRKLIRGEDCFSRRGDGMNNASALGYMISSMKRLGYDEEKIREMESVMYHRMDEMTEDQAEKVYKQF